jgi:hypothetical protein
MKKALAALAMLAAALLAGCSDTASDDHTGHGSLPDGGSAGPSRDALGGQAAFATLQEVVRILEADPDTDWATVDLAALRAHLLDMDALTLRAKVEETPIPGGFRAVVTGDHNVVGAASRMVPEHLGVLSESRPWAHALDLAEGRVVLEVTSDDAGQEAKLRGLGFFGVMATDSHHAEHHVALARGAGMH